MAGPIPNESIVLYCIFAGAFVIATAAAIHRLLRADIYAAAAAEHVQEHGRRQRRYMRAVRDRAFWDMADGVAADGIVLGEGDDGEIAAVDPQEEAGERLGGEVVEERFPDFVARPESAYLASGRLYFLGAVCV